MSSQISIHFLFLRIPTVTVLTLLLQRTALEATRTGWTWTTIREGRVRRPDLPGVNLFIMKSLLTGKQKKTIFSCHCNLKM